MSIIRKGWLSLGQKRTITVECVKCKRVWETTSPAPVCVVCGRDGTKKEET